MPFDPISLVPVVGTIVSQISQRQTEKRAKKRADQEYERALEDNRADYDRNRNDYEEDRKHQEEYDSPLATRQRMEDAGLNPALMYGNASSAMGGTSDPQNGNSPSAPSSSKVDFEAMEVDDIASVAINAERLRMQGQLIEADTQLKNAQLLKTLSEVDKTSLENQLFRDTYDEMVRKAGLVNEQTSTDIEVKKKGIEVSDTQIELNRIKARLTEQQIVESKAKVQKIMADTYYTIDENRRQELQAELDRAQTEEETKILVQKLLQEVENVKLKEAESTNIPEKREKLLAEVAIIQYQRTHLISSDVKEWISLIPFFGKKK